MTPEASCQDPRMELLTVSRAFSIWDYTVSHSTLLLRSVEADAFATRFDVMFKPVAALKLPTHMSGLTVRDSNSDEEDELRSEASLLAGVSARLTGADESDYRLFVLDCDGAVGWVLASVMVAYEDEAGYEEPSAILHGTPPGALVVTVNT
jgi:hypothetical protein